MLFPSELQHPRQLLSLSGQGGCQLIPWFPCQLLALETQRSRVPDSQWEAKERQISTSTKCQMCKCLCFHFYFIDGQEKLDSALESAKFRACGLIVWDFTYSHTIFAFPSPSFHLDKDALLNHLAMTHTQNVFQGSPSPSAHCPPPAAGPIFTNASLLTFESFHLVYFVTQWV